MSVHSRYSNGDGAPIRNYDEVRIVMVGRTGAGKSATGNTILGDEAFPSKFSFTSWTTSCKKVRGVVAGRKVAVVDTPGLFDTRFSIDQTQCIRFAAPGPHVFLVVIRLGRFTDEEKKCVEMIQETFGEMSYKYTMILFTGADLLEDASFEEMLEMSPELRELIRKCDGRYHVFNNKDKDRSQVTDLLQKINIMVRQNGGSHYTNEMLQEAERAIQEEKERILRETAEQRLQEIEDIKKRLETEYLDRENKMLEEFQKQQERNEQRMNENMEELKKALKEEIEALKEQMKEAQNNAQHEKEAQHDQNARDEAELGHRLGVGAGVGATAVGVVAGVAAGAKSGAMAGSLFGAGGVILGGLAGAGVGALTYRLKK